MIKSKLVKPLRKLSLLPNHHQNNTSIVDMAPEHPLFSKEVEQNDIISLLPKEVVLKIFSFLSFQDLIRVQLTCRIWRKLALDVSIWRNRFQELNSRYTDIYAHKPSKSIDANELPWKTRYCQAITFANWRMGSVQNLHKIDDNNNSRLLSVKLKDKLLVTLTEDNTVKLYEHSNELGFQFKMKWYFGDPIAQPNTCIECIDILPEINILVVAQRGSKCMFYDINKGSKNDPIQVLKGGSHPWFIPDSISVNQDYFAVSGRKPSVVFVWNWRKGVKLSNRAFDNQPHNVFLSGDNLFTVSVDGLLHVFDIFDNMTVPSATHFLNACSIPCIAYDNSLSIVSAPHGSRRIHHYSWNKLETPTSPISVEQEHEEPDVPQNTSTIPRRRKRLSTTFINFLGLKSSSSNPNTIYNNKKYNRSQNDILSYKYPPTNQPQSSLSTGLLTKKSSREFYRSVRIRRHSSYNDYGYACQMKTDQYIKQHIDNLLSSKVEPLPSPNFKQGPRLVHSIRTTPLGSTAKEIVNVAMHDNRIATVNRHGDIAVYALNGTTAARVASSFLNDSHQEWMDEDMVREDDDLSDGYDFVRTRLAMGTMGIVYGSKNGSLWWLDFGCKFL